MTNEITTTNDMSQIEKVLMTGNLAELTPAQRVEYYNAVCKSTGLNPLTRPFDYITLNNKLTLYARKDATDQLRKINSVSIDDVEISEVGNTYMVKVKGHDASGRSDVEIGVVAKSDMQGNAGNAQMKAVTKAKRRLTLSICGLGWLDETEVETIKDARPVVVDNTGEILNGIATDAEQPKSAAPAPQKWTFMQTDAIIKAGYADNDFAAEGMLGLSCLTVEASPAECVKWAAIYRGIRDPKNNASPKAKDAAAIANSEYKAIYKPQ